MDNTSWEKVDLWYDHLVGKEGHYYHKHVIFPALFPLLELNRFQDPALLDLACGQGVLAHHLPPSISYYGVDLSPSLIKAAKEKKKKHHHFAVADICKPLSFNEESFTHATLILALQNIADPLTTFKETYRCLKDEGIFIIVINHPCFRIPRQTHWEIDPSKKLQYRRVDAYLSPLKIPIQVHPGQKGGKEVWAFHYPLSMITRFLSAACFVIREIEEWTSDKKSSGAAARMENRARKEFPLFLAIKAQKTVK